MHAPWLVRGHHYEDLTRLCKTFLSALETAVIQNSVLTLDILKDGRIQGSIQPVNPYRLDQHQRDLVLGSGA